MARTGRCLCGAVSYTIDAEIAAVEACHCGMCQRWSGGIHLGFVAASAAVRFEGADNITCYPSSDWAERAFCRTCGTHLFYRFTGEGPGSGDYSFGVGGLDDRTGLALEKEIYVDCKPDAYTLSGAHPRLTEQEFLKSIGFAD